MNTSIIDIETKLKIGTKLKSLREHSNFNQSNIAKYLNVDQSLISKLEAGERTLTADMLERLTDLFGVDLLDVTIDADQIKPLSIALRTNDINEEDLNVISAINKIAINCKFMTKLLEAE
ncbi:MAG: hypothetical protein LLF82_000829 [Dehalococcoides mccartyi]|uniref:helix-turn-helix domain-containing protein n=1 Tax=Dehalococcoides mccartyi TaxID=61435 RepID=UPI00242F3C0B|nr:helix-turn-helix transcriptional regulator [Dehalococcoides mccartyi]MCF7635347.1 hypothetical protein [Dehalococcoides mccartyi]BEL01475.1 hypothetical protein DMOBY_13280 [Dehalococcoides mccartyi]